MLDRLLRNSCILQAMILWLKAEIVRDVLFDSAQTFSLDVEHDEISEMSLACVTQVKIEQN